MNDARALREKVAAIIRRGAIYPQTSDELAALAIDLVLEEAARALYGCTRFDQEIFDSMAESRDGTYVKIEEAEAAIRALTHSS